MLRGVNMTVHEADLVLSPNPGGLCCLSHDILPTSLK